MADRATIAGELEDAAAQKVVLMVDGPQDPRNPGAVAYALLAQTEATLALCQRVAELTDKLGDHFRDVDADLDGIRVAIVDGFEGIRSDGVGVG